MMMWTIFTCLYNYLIVLFIAIHLFVGTIISFGFGVYSGIYLTQNYEIPRINEPAKLWERFIKFTDQYKKPNTSKVSKASDRISMLSILTCNDDEESSPSDALNRLSTTESVEDTVETNVISSELETSNKITEN